METKKKIVWLDLETTGLNPMSDEILEVGVIVTDQHLNELTRWCRVLKAHPGQLGAMPPPVVLMHASSGLWTDCLGSELRVPDVQDELLHFLTKHGCKGAPLAGNSVGDFDRHFLRKYMPQVNDLLSHRSLNVSTFKVLWDLWELPAAENAPKPAHRSLADCQQSINALKGYLARGLKVPEGVL